MAFQASNFAVISPSGAIPAQTLQSGSVQGAPGLYSYQSTDTLATIGTADYFASLANILFAGDFLFIKANDGSAVYQVSSASKSPQSVSISLFLSGITLPWGVDDGGTGLSSVTAYAVLCGGTTATGALQQVSGLGTAGQVLKSNGAGALPSWQNESGGGGLSWSVVSGTSQAMVADNGYIPNNAGLVTLTMPATASVGETFAVTGLGSGGWLLQMNAGQIANFGNAPTTTAGSLASTNRYDAIELICVVADTTFVARSSIGNLTVA